MQMDRAWQLMASWTCPTACWCALAALDPRCTAFRAERGARHPGMHTQLQPPPNSNKELLPLSAT